MDKFSTGDRIDGAISLNTALPAGSQLLATVSRGRQVVRVLRQGAGLTTTNQQLFTFALLPEITALFTPGAYSITLAIYTSDHQRVKVSHGSLDFMMYDSETGKEAAK